MVQVEIVYRALHYILKGKDPDPPSAFDAIAPYHYKPAFVEAHIMEQLIDWGWNQANRKVLGCSIWTTKEVTAGDGFYATIHFELN